MNARVRTLAAGKEVFERGLGITVNVYSAHKVVLAREYRYRLLGEVIALFKKVLVYH